MEFPQWLSVTIHTKLICMNEKIIVILMKAFTEGAQTPDEKMKIALSSVTKSKVYWGITIDCSSDKQQSSI